MRPALAQPGDERADELGDRRDVLVARVADAEAAADVEHRGAPAELGLRARSQNAASRSTASMLSSTRASCEPTWKWTPSTSSPSVRDSSIACSAASAESPNFEPSCAVRIDSCVTASTPGVSRTSTRCTPAAAARSASSGASSTTAAPAAAARAELLVRLVVAVEEDPLAGDLRGLREGELAERRDVGADALVGEHAQQRDVRERLRPVDDERAGAAAAYARACARRVSSQ